MICNMPMYLAVVCRNHGIFIRPLSSTPVFKAKSKRKEHWQNLASKTTASDKALEHFDDFYKQIFRLKWPSVRLGLLSPQKYVALVNNFGDTEKTVTELENSGAINMKQLFEVCERNLRTQKNESEKESTMNEAFAMDRLLDEKTKSQEETDVKIFYPDGREDMKKLFTSSKNEEDKSEESEEPSSFENDRVIDPELGIDSGALHEFVPATKLKGMEDYVAESEYYAYYKTTTDVPVGTDTQHRLNFPDNLRVYTHSRGVFERYPPPSISSTGVFNYFLMDGASIMPVLALGVRPGDIVLDMCSAPGGKALALLQTMLPKLVVCNDISRSRINRIEKVFNQFLYDYTTNWKGIVSVQNQDGASIEDTGMYDKILVDVPCTNDRLSLHEDDNNIFKQSRMKERLRIPEVQSSLLSNALRIVKPGGTVVYSTCSLSPVQNDGVVGMALRTLWQQHQMKFTVVNMEPSLRCTSQLINYGRSIGLKYGHLIVPFIPSNFGPMYFCKIVKDI